MSDVNNEMLIIDTLGSRGQLMARRSARDVREAPVYSTVEAARYLQLPPSTVRGLSVSAMAKPTQQARFSQ
jgi:hypothetical protein